MAMVMHLHQEENPGLLDTSVSAPEQAERKLNERMDAVREEIVNGFKKQLCSVPC